MRIPPFNYPLDDRLLNKIDLMILRCTQTNPKRDAVLLFEGAEGEGKTTFSVAIGYYVAWRTGREFDHTHVFFDLKKLIDYAQSTEGKIIIWDEPALQALSKDALTTIVKDLERLLMMARNKRHFIMINMAYFNKFSEYIVCQRPLGMIHIYSRGEIQPGRFVYIKKKNLENLWQFWRRRRERNYRKYCSKAIRGMFPDVLNQKYKNNVLSHFDFNVYEKNKNEAIMMIGNTEKKSKINRDLIVFQFKAAYSNDNIKKVAEDYGVSERTVYLWREHIKNHPELFINPKEIKV